MSEVIACANQKGGVGKTTTVVSLASYLALAGRNVLIVDLDPQGNATSGLGIDKGAVTASVYDALVGGMPMADLIQPSQLPGLSIAPSSRHLAAAEVELVPMTERERRLALALNPIADTYDYVILDCPPSLGLLTINALAAADTVLVPIQCEYYALEGLGALMGTINRVRDRINPSLALRGVVLTMFDARTTLSSDVSREVHRHLGSQVFDVGRSSQRAAGRGAQLRPADPAVQPGVAWRAGVRAARRRSDGARSATGRERRQRRAPPPG